MQLDLAKSDKMSSSNKTFIFLLLCSNCLKMIKRAENMSEPHCTKLYLIVSVFFSFFLFSFLFVFVDLHYSVLDCFEFFRR